jgi:hypothetical protein
MSNSTSPRRLLDRRAVGARYGNRHSRTVKRWVDAGMLPKPATVIAGREYWDEDQLDRHDRARVAERAAANSPTPARRA